MLAGHTFWASGSRDRHCEEQRGFYAGSATPRNDVLFKQLLRIRETAVFF